MNIKIIFSSTRNILYIEYIYFHFLVWAVASCDFVYNALQGQNLLLLWRFAFSSLQSHIFFFFSIFVSHFFSGLIFFLIFFKKNYVYSLDYGLKLDPFGFLFFVSPVWLLRKFWKKISFMSYHSKRILGKLYKVSIFSCYFLFWLWFSWGPNRGL